MNTSSNMHAYPVACLDLKNLTCAALEAILFLINLLYLVVSENLITIVFYVPPKLMILKEPRDRGPLRNLY